MIIDASVAFKWIVPEEDSDAASALLGGALYAPQLLISEVGNALWKAIRRGELYATDTLFNDFARLGRLVTLCDEEGVAARALAIAVQIDHPIYDCTYLALAEIMDTVLVTADVKFVSRLRAAKISNNVKLLSGRT